MGEISRSSSAIAPKNKLVYRKREREKNIRGKLFGIMDKLDSFSSINGERLKQENIRYLVVFRNDRKIDLAVTISNLYNQFFKRHDHYTCNRLDSSGIISKKEKRNEYLII